MIHIYEKIRFPKWKNDFKEKTREKFNEISIIINFSGTLLIIYRQ